MKYFFVDTNLFLQCRDISDLPWDEVSNAKHVRLIIPRAVQNEIDKLKADGNSRRAKRARNTNSYFRQIILSDGEQLQVKNTSHANVILTFSSHVAASPGDVPDVALDSARPDDSILLEVISYRALYPDHDVALLTHDTNPLLTAKRLKIPFQIIPDGWLLSPEPDEREKEIRNLKTRITEIENTHPKIEFTFGKEGVSVPNKICADIVIYPPFSQAEINTLIEQIKIEYPLEQSFDEKLKNQLHSNSPFATPAITLASLQFGKSYKQPTAEEINKYKNVDYPNWLRKIERKLIELPDFLSVHNNKIGVVIALENIGNSPAEHAIFRVETSSGILIAPPIDEDDEDMSKNWKFINPPSPPRGKYRDISELYGVNAASLLMRDFEPLISPLVQPRSRDRHRFYWKPKRPSLPQALWNLNVRNLFIRMFQRSFTLIC
jgi:hypothetical protein